MNLEIHPSSADIIICCAALPHHPARIINMSLKGQLRPHRLRSLTHELHDNPVLLEKLLKLLLAISI